MKTIMLLGLCSLLLLSGCDSGQAVPVKPTPTAAAVKGQPLGERIIAEGRVTPVRSVDLSLSVASTVADVLVAEGDHVTSGQVLARLDARQQVAKEWGRAVLMVTHDPRIAAYADRIIFMKDGRIVNETRLDGKDNGRNELVDHELNAIAGS